MASSNIKLFDENKGNMLSDKEYNIAAQRLNGVQIGVASSKLQNKTLYQTSLIAYALAQLMNANGIDANDTAAVTTFVNNLSSSIVQKVVDKATKAEAIAGENNVKWLSPYAAKALVLNNTTKSGESDPLTSTAGVVGQFYLNTKTNEVFICTAVSGNTYTWISTSEINVGDIIYSVKTAAQMGDKYLPCDGSALDTAAYPELAAVLKEKKYPTSSSDFIKHTLSFDLSWVTESNPSVSAVRYLNYINGYYIASVDITAEASLYYGQLYYSLSLDTMFTHVNDVSATWIKCVNGYIICAGFSENASSFSSKVATSPAGQWITGPSFKVTDFTLKYTQKAFTSVDLIYDGSKYVFGVLAHDDTSTDYYCLCTFSSLSNATADSFYNTNYVCSNGFRPLYYQNGYYIFMNSRSQFIYSATWNSGWTKCTYGSTSNQYNAGIVYYKEKWYIFSDSAGASSTIWISSTSAIDSSYAATVVLSADMYYNSSYHIDYDGLKLVCNKGALGNSFVIAVFDDSANAVQTVAIPYLNGSASGTVNAFTNFFSAYYNDLIAYVFQSSKFLPNISSIDTVNAYIKALPGN